MDLLLINPGTRYKESLSEHIGVLSLSSFTRSKDYTVDVMDMALENLGIRDALAYLKDKNPKVLGISMLDNTKDKGFSLIKAARNAGYRGKIVLGGYFPSFSAREILRDFPEVDYVVRGESEITLVDLLEYLIGTQTKKPQQVRLYCTQSATY